MGPQRSSATRRQKTMLRGWRPIVGDPATWVSSTSSAISDTTSLSTNAVSDDNASSCPSAAPMRTELLVDLDSIQEFPAIPSGREEYLKRQGRTDKLVEGLESMHATSENIFKAQREEIQLRRHQVSVLREQCRVSQWRVWNVAPA